MEDKLTETITIRISKQQKELLQAKASASNQKTATLASQIFSKALSSTDLEVSSPNVADIVHKVYELIAPRLDAVESELAEMRDHSLAVENTMCTTDTIADETSSKDIEIADLKAKLASSIPKSKLKSYLQAKYQEWQPKNTTYGYGGTDFLNWIITQLGSNEVKQ